MHSRFQISDIATNKK